MIQIQLSDLRQRSPFLDLFSSALFPLPALLFEIFFQIIGLDEGEETVLGQIVEQALHLVEERGKELAAGREDALLYLIDGVLR